MKATKKEHGKRILSGVLIVAILAVLVFLITWSPEPDRAPQQTAEVIKRDVKRTLDESGVMITRRIDGEDQKVVQLFINENDLDELNVDSMGVVTIEALGAEVTGRLDSISDEPRISGSITEYEGIVVLIDSVDDLKNGMHADVEFNLAENTDALAVPNEALYKDGEQYKVDRVLETRRIYLKRLGVDKATQDVESVNVEIGLEGDEYTVITSGLNEGDVVVAE